MFITDEEWEEIKKANGVHPYHLSAEEILARFRRRYPDVTMDLIASYLPFLEAGFAFYHKRGYWSQNSEAVAFAQEPLEVSKGLKAAHEIFVKKLDALEKSRIQMTH